MKILLSIFCLLILVSCSPTPEIPSDKLVERQEVTYQVNSEKPFTGTSVEYFIDTIIKDQFEERVLWKRITYKDGVLNGLFESFHPNGQLEFRKNYKNGKQDGLYELFSENGQLLDRENYKNGREVSKTRFYYHENGQLIRKGNYKDGKLDGLSETFDEKGQLRVKYCYKNDEKVDVSYCEN
jgi:antitoxin component YwqK of YwqJK toxin-antitoxin module